MAPRPPFNSTHTQPCTGHHSTSPPERPTSTLQLFQRHQALPQSHSTSHSTTSPIKSRTTISLQSNHYHQHHYSFPTGTPHSRCATNRAAGGHAPTNHPADCGPSRRCSRGRAQLTPQQLIVSPRTFTQRVMTKKNATSVQVFTFHFFDFFYIFLPILLGLTPGSNLSIPHAGVFYLTAAVFFKLVIVTCNRAPLPHLAVNGAPRRL